MELALRHLWHLAMGAIDGNVVAAIIASATAITLAIAGGGWAMATRLGRLEQRVNDLVGSVQGYEERVDRRLDSMDSRIGFRRQRDFPNGR